MSILEMVSRKNQLEYEINRMTNLLACTGTWVLTANTLQCSDVRDFTEGAVKAHLKMLEKELAQINDAFERAYAYLERQQ